MQLRDSITKAIYFYRPGLEKLMNDHNDESSLGNMNNELKYAMTSIMVLLTLKAQALGLGELVIESELGEPLSATIPVIQSRGEFLPADELRISINADKDILRQGVNSFLAKESIRLKLEETINDDVVIKLSSDRPLNEPIMNFMLELQWANGRLVREFNVLLDPPGLGRQTSTSVATTPAPTVNQPRVPSNNRFSSANKTPTPYKNRVYGPIQRGETLSEIAQRVRPGGYNIKLDDMVRVLVSNNPSAFINNDANLLLEGSLLQVPTGNQILAQLDGSSIESKPVTTPETLRLQTELTSLNSTELANSSNNTQNLASLRLTTSIDLSRLSNLTAGTLVPESGSTPEEDPLPVVDSSTAAIRQDEIPFESSVTEIPSSLVEEPTGELEDLIDSTNLETSAINNTESDFDGVVGEETNIIESDIASIREELNTLEETSQSEDVTATETPPLAAKSNPIYLVLSVLGAVISLVMLALWWVMRRNRKDEPARYQAIPNVQRPSVKSSPSAHVHEKTQTKTAASVSETAVRSTDDSESKASDEYVDTIIMSPEEFKSVGIDKTAEVKTDVLSDNEIDYISSIEDETLINDYMETVADSENDGTEQDAITEEAIEYAKSDNEIVMDVSVPLDHEDDEVNDIITNLMEMDDDGLIEYTPEKKPEIDSEPEPFDIDPYVTANIEPDTDLMDTISNHESIDDDEEIIDLEPDMEEYNLDELVVDFQHTNPEKEFEKEISVFMAYGDFQGAEERIETAIAEDAQNPVYQLALLTLNKVTGKYGAALEIAQTLKLRSDSLSEENRKKLELLIEDLNADDDSASVAS